MIIRYCAGKIYFLRNGADDRRWKPEEAVMS